MGQQPSPAGRSLTSEVSTSGTASADEMLNIASERFFFFLRISFLRLDFSPVPPNPCHA